LKGRKRFLKKGENRPFGKSTIKRKAIIFLDGPEIEIVKSGKKPRVKWKRNQETLEENVSTRWSGETGKRTGEKRDHKQGAMEGGARRIGEGQ